MIYFGLRNKCGNEQETIQKEEKLRKRKIKRFMIAYLLRAIVILIPTLMMIPIWKIPIDAFTLFGQKEKCLSD